MNALQITNISLTDAFDKAFVAFDVHRGDLAVSTGEFIRNAEVLLDWSMPGLPFIDWKDGNMDAHDDFSFEEREHIAQHVDAVLQHLVDYKATLASALDLATSSGASVETAHGIQVRFEELISIDAKLYDLGCRKETDWSLDFDTALEGTDYERAAFEGCNVIQVKEYLAA